MSKVLQMIDFEHLMDFEQYIRIEHMIERDMKEESYVNPDGLLEDEPSSVNYSDDIPF